MNRIVFAACVIGLAIGLLTAGCSQPSPEAGIVTTEQVHRLVSGGTNAVTLLHIWATWCPPCVREFPDIVSLAKKYSGRGLRVLLVSADAQSDVDAVTRFLGKHGVDWQTYIAENVNDDFIRAVSTSWSGALPASFYYLSSGKLADGREGSRSYATHEETMLKILKAQEDAEKKGR